jgi:hypothetical protein
MASSLPEELKSFAEFYPNHDARLKLHYYFVHRFLAWYVHDNPFNFVMHDGVDPTRFIQARLAIQAQHFLGPTNPPAHHLFRRVTDLEAWTEEVAGRPALFIQMPVPETFGHAFFAAAVLLTKADAFHRMEESVLQYVRSRGTSPIMPDTESVRRAHARFFTLERTMNLEGEEALRAGRFCEWTAGKEHLNSGLAVSASREKFVEMVARLSQHGDHILAVASHRSGEQTFPLHPFRPSVSSEPKMTTMFHSQSAESDL